MARPKWLNPVNPLAHPGRAKYWAPSKGEEIMARRARIPNPLAEIARPGANKYVKSAGERKEEIREKSERRSVKAVNLKTKNNG